MHNTQIPLSIFIPVYNEEEILCKNTEKLIQFVDTLGISYEIVICSNGSTDRTVEIGHAMELKYPDRMRFFSIREQGVGRALKYCISRFKYHYILTLDMDLSADLSFIPHALTHINGNDIAIGSKRAGTQTRNIIRKLGSGLYIFIARLLLGIAFTDYSLGTKVYKKTILERYNDLISDYGTDYVINIVYHAFHDGYRICEIPVKCFDNRKSKFNLLEEGIYRYKKIFTLWMNHKNSRKKSS